MDKYTIISNIIGAFFIIFGVVLNNTLEIPITAGISMGIGLMFIIYSKEIGGKYK